VAEAPVPSFEVRLAEEIAAWQREGIVDARVARRILQRYRVATPAVEDEVDAAARGRSATIFGTFGAILVGLGAILFVASNWEGMDRLARLALLVAALILSAALAFLLKRSGHARIGAALVLVNTLVFGASVFFVGQTYHVRVGDPLLFLLWAFGAVAMALAATSRPSLFLGIAALVAWYWSLMIDWGAMRWPGYQGGPDALAAPAVVGLGVLLLAAARFAARTTFGRPFVLVMAITGLLLAFATIFVLSFEFIWEQLGRSANMNSGDFVMPLFRWSVIAILIGSVLAAAGAAWRANWARSAIIEAAGLIGIEAVITLVIVLHPLPSALAYAIFFDVVALGAIAWAVQIGLASGREAFINAALVLFGLLVLARYFDFFGTLLDRSIGFIGAGVLLIVVGYALDRSRRLLLTRARVNAVPGAA
jgi:uncharacterized membrane protein